MRASACATNRRNKIVSRDEMKYLGLLRDIVSDGMLDSSNVSRCICLTCGVENLNSLL